MLDGLKGKTHFEVLGIPESASPGQIKTAFFKLAKAYHPDTVPAGSPPELAKLKADVFAAVSESYRVLGDDKLRAAYVEELKAGSPEQVDAARILAAESAFQKGCISVKARKFQEALELLEEAVKLNDKEGEFFAWLDSALGCETLSVEATLRMMLPWETAQLEIWMLAVATMVPVRSFRMTRAGMLGVICRFCSRAMNPTGSFSTPAGIRTCTEVESTAWAELVNTSLIASAMSAAVVKSGSRNNSSTHLSRTIAVGISRSTSAPPTICATVGWFFVTVAPPPPPWPAVKPPTEMGPCATA